MAERTLTLVCGLTELRLSDLDEDKEMDVSLHFDDRPKGSLYLNKRALISLRDHLDYLLKKC